MNLSDAVSDPHLNSKRFDVVRSVSTSSEIRQIELNLIPSIIQTHGHRANERLDARRGLIVARTETTANISIVEYLRSSTKRTVSNAISQGNAVLLVLRT